MPMRKGYADKVFIVTSGENMSIHAAANMPWPSTTSRTEVMHLWEDLILNAEMLNAEDEKSGGTGRCF